VEKNWKLSPSDFAFLWEECTRCFYLKVAMGFRRPRTPMPKVFNRIDSIMKEHFKGKNSAAISPALPPGVVEHAERWVESRPISLPGRSSTCFIRGKFDTAIRFEERSYGVVDFKTAGSNAAHVALYGRQLHAYAYALENPAPGRLSLAPVSRLGLLCVEPVNMVNMEDGSSVYRTEVHWIECPRDDSEFLKFLDGILEILERPDPPAASPTCPWCRYRDAARRTAL